MSAWIAKLGQMLSASLAVLRVKIMKTIAKVVGFFLIVAGSLTVFALGYLLFYGVDSIQQFAVIALVSCLCWFLSYLIYQTIRVMSYQERAALAQKLPPDKSAKPDAPHWTLTPRTFSAAMAMVTGLLFAVLALLWFKVELPFLVIAPFILFFPFSYMAYSAFQRPVRIQRLRSDFELLTAQWDEALYQQSTSFFNYALHITLAVLASLLGLFIIFAPLSADLAALPIAAIGFSPDVLRAMSLGFLGSFLFSAYYIYRRYTTSDLLPPVYLYCAMTILLGMIFNYMAFDALLNISENPPEGLGAGLLGLLSFAIGFFPILAVQWLSQTVYKALGQRRRRSDLFPLDQVDGISQSQEIRLRDFGIDDAQNLASTEMPLLLINTPFPVQTVVDWVDQAILMVLLNDLNALDNFRKAHVRTMTDFRDLWGPYSDKYLELKKKRDKLRVGDVKIQGLTEQMTALRDEQTDVANALNSNVALLTALYISTNFDMNIHYLTNYRKNVELLLPDWTSARYNRFLIQAYQAKPNDPTGQSYKKELTRLWNIVTGYIQMNGVIEAAQEQNKDDGSHGIIVEPTSIEARIGLARLYHQAKEAATEQEKENYRQFAEAQYDAAANQILIAITDITNASDIGKTPDWAAVQETASRAAQARAAQSVAPRDQKPASATQSINQLTITVERPLPSEDDALQNPLKPEPNGANVGQWQGQEAAAGGGVKKPDEPEASASKPKRSRKKAQQQTPETVLEQAKAESGAGGNGASPAKAEDAGAGGDVENPDEPEEK
jgi:hypothetical protein